MANIKQNNHNILWLFCLVEIRGFEFLTKNGKNIGIYTDFIAIFG